MAAFDEVRARVVRIAELAQETGANIAEMLANEFAYEVETLDLIQDLMDMGDVPR